MTIRLIFRKFSEDVQHMKVGFIGLGIMGWRMAEHLAGAGHTLAVWTHSDSKRLSFTEKNAASAFDTPRAVAEASEVIFLCVGDTAMSESCILGADGLIHGASAGTIIVDCSTVLPSASKAIGLALAEKGVHFVDAPCTGSKAGAENGTLSFMVGGEPDVIERIRPLLENMGKRIYYCGLQGMGLHAKVTQNLILGNLLQAFNEGLVLSTKGGVDPAVMLEILNNSGAQSAFISANAPAVFRRDFEPVFALKWMEKDLSLALATGASLNVPLFVTAASQQGLRAAIARGWGEEDIRGSIRLLEEITSCEVRKEL
jgi:3-hydroxyisobutyrate dehydrogenase-like beta-hydroxyacid dehydrogenase